MQIEACEFHEVRDETGKAVPRGCIGTTSELPMNREAGDRINDRLGTGPAPVRSPGGQGGPPQSGDRPGSHPSENDALPLDHSIRANASQDE